ncbi:hypothetical protein HPB48_021803 [Haemaphysalis longicornis]|uniref:DDE Tnp4 domain-containing protein n=1 Tax=Haemaphysalis longicornis TaxID=44386 RepID=A0A9J6GC99_HAELO|nr:hypothetical protein HPB48_021803 [Haemaphysalis longicornis]
MVRKVSQALCERRTQFVHFPTSRQEQRETTRVFFERLGFPGVVGAIDGTHIPIKNPGGDTQALYISRKNFHSLNVQLVCDADEKITNVVARWRGSAHDNRIWEESNLREKFAANEVNGVLLGDNGYACSWHLLTHVLSAQARTPEDACNRAHTSTRNVIKRVNGQMKNRFRCLIKKM